MLIDEIASSIFPPEELTTTKIVNAAKRVISKKVRGASLIVSEKTLATRNFLNSNCNFWKKVELV